MKLMLSTLILCFSHLGFTQEKEKPCGQIPVAKPEVHAKYDGDIKAYFSNALPTDKKEGTISATFRMYVDCNGKVTKAKLYKGEMPDANQKAILEKIYAMNWTPAQHEGENVTSNVFIVVEITNGKAEITVY